MADEEHSTAATIRRDAIGTVRLVVIGIIVLAIVLVGLDNRDDVRLGYVVGDTNAPIWVVLVGAGIAGIVIGWLLKHRPRGD